MYKTKSLKKYSDDLAARLPAPGGGSASALTACLGASLISMAVNFTIGKPKYAPYEKYLKATLKTSEALRRRFLQLVDLDVVAYKSKDCRKALAVPLDIARLCAQAMELCPDLTRRGNRNLISDVAVAAQLLESAFAAAGVNVDINLKFIADKKLTRKLQGELAKKGRRINTIRQQTEERVNAVIRG
jgi:formiminotetrahydrofolate cyclodeaminase